MNAPLAQVPESPPTLREMRGSLLLTAVISNIVAAVVVLLEPGSPVGGNFMVANVIGLGIWGSTCLVRHLSAGRISRVPALLIAAPAGALLGMGFGSLMGFSNPIVLWLGDPLHQWRPIATTLVLTYVSILFVARHLAASDYRAGLDTHRRQAAEARQGQALARLALLQAQIEPHFLFNTLANVRSMVDRDPRTAGQMLDLLNRYLRASLGRTRTPLTTCGAEMELIEALLGIAAIRLGARLRYEIRLPDALREAHLPPLLLQPLVENALKHGIEPAVEGGEIHVECTAALGRLLLRVRDTGIGFPENAPAGVGLSNIRARLASLYGSEGELALYHNTPRGTVAEVTVPLALQ